MKSLNCTSMKSIFFPMERLMLHDIPENNYHNYVIIHCTYPFRLLLYFLHGCTYMYIQYIYNMYIMNSLKYSFKSCKIVLAMLEVLGVILRERNWKYQ